VRQVPKFETPKDREDSQETLISMVPSPSYDSVKIKHEPELQDGFKALRDKGLRITNYLE
jgi:hypothetical protein